MQFRLTTLMAENQVVTKGAGITIESDVGGALYFADKWRLFYNLKIRLLTSRARNKK